MGLGRGGGTDSPQGCPVGTAAVTEVLLPDPPSRRFEPQEWSPSSGEGVKLRE